jgi:RTX calcium-binding nonapeptide repeat (4 copies)
MRRAGILITSLVCLLVPSAATAATVEVETRPGSCGQACSKYGGEAPPVRTLVVSGEAAERNLLAIGQNATGWVVHDGGAPLTAATGCRAVGAGVVACDGNDTRVRIVAGAGDDEVAVTVLPPTSADDIATPVYVSGGPGNDVLHGGAGDDVLDGGGGRDRMLGGAGGDLLDDQDGPNADADVFEGGPGADAVWYAGRRSPVRVDLARAAAAQGERGEGDRLAGIEHAIGGAGDDVLAGGRRGEVLEGRGGDDRLSGRAGSDSLFGGPGRDVLAGGAGHDDLGTRDGRADRVACGAGRDTLLEEVGTPNVEYTDEIDYETLGPDARDVVGRDCEEAAVDASSYGLTVPVRPRHVGPTSATFDNPCFADCARGRIVLTAGGRVVGRVRFPRARRMRRIAVPLAGLERGRVVQVRWLLRNDLGGEGAAYRIVLR